MIKTSKITKLYKKKGIVFSDVSICFNDSSFNVIIGKSGSGKTTLLNIIGGFDSYDCGELFFDGMKITKQNLDKYRNEEVGFVFQQINLINSISIKENLKIAFDMCHKKMDVDKVRDLFDKVGLLDDVPLTDFLKKKPTQLSVGQRQRVAIVRALIKKPKVLILDEPTSALDEENAANIVLLLKELSKSITVIVSTHNKQFLSDFADQIIEIKNGKAERVKESQEIDLPSENHHDMKRGFLSFGETLKLALLNLKNKKIRLMTSFILSTLTALLLGLAFCFQTCDPTKVLLRTQFSNNEKTCVITNQLIYKEHDSYFEQYKQDSFTDSQIDFIGKYTENNCFPVVYISTEHNGLYPEIINHENNMQHTAAFNFFTKYSAGVEIDSSKMNEAGLIPYSKLKEETNCRFPENYNEIAINSMIAECIVKYGLIQEFDEHHNITKVLNVKEPDDIIGQKTIHGLTIVGIYSSTDGAEEFFHPYLFEDPADLNSENYNYFRYMANGTSISQYVYLKPGYSSYISETEKNASSYYIKLKGDVESDFRFISNLSSEKHKIQFENRYNGFTSILTVFTGYFQIIAWAVILVLVFVSLVISLSLFYANVKSMEKDLGILKSMGASKMSISFIVVMQSLIVSLFEFVLALLGLLIIFLRLNAKIGIALFSISFSLIGILILMIVGSALVITVLSSRKAILGRPVNIIEEK